MKDSLRYILSDYKRVLEENEEAKAIEKDYNMLKEYYKEQNEPKTVKFI